MRTTLKRSRATKGQLYLAVVLLLGLLLVGYGYFQESKIGLWIGLLVIVAGVLKGVMHIVTRGGS